MSKCPRPGSYCCHARALITLNAEPTPPGVAFIHESKDSVNHPDVILLTSLFPNRVSPHKQAFCTLKCQCILYRYLLAGYLLKLYLAYVLPLISFRIFLSPSISTAMHSSPSFSHTGHILCHPAQCHRSSTTLLDDRLIAWRRNSSVHICGIAFFIFDAPSPRKASAGCLAIFIKWLNMFVSAFTSP